MTKPNPEKPVILIVDDSKVIRLAARKMMGKDYEVVEAADGVEGWEQIQQNESISVVFTDMQMPNMNGLELLEKVRASNDDRIAAMPVIMITGQEDNAEAKQHVFDMGVTDFITKPFESLDLISRAKSYARLNRKVAELEQQTGHDKLTGLFNANSFSEHGAKAFSFAQRHKVSISVAILEVDNFQKIFLTHGKAVAQQIIIEVSKRMAESMRAEDVAARTGVARFALLLSLSSVADVQLVVGRIRESIHKLVFATGKEKLRITLAAGISSIELDAETDFAGLVGGAETALGDALNSETDKVATHATAAQAAPAEAAAAPVKPPEVSQADIEQALGHILHGNYLDIPKAHLPAVIERLTAFMQYVENKHDNQHTA